MLTKGHITISGTVVRIVVTDNANFRTIKLGAELGERLPEEEKYFERYPGQLRRLLAGKKICL